MNSTDEDGPDDAWLREAKTGSISRGLLLLAGGHVAVCFVVAALDAVTRSNGNWLMWIACLGVTQLAHVLPLAARMNAKGQHRTAKGIWIGAGITALLAAGCWGVGIATFQVR